MRKTVLRHFIPRHGNGTDESYMEGFDITLLRSKGKNKRHSKRRRVPPKTTKIYPGKFPVLHIQNCTIRYSKGVSNIIKLKYVKGGFSIDLSRVRVNIVGTVRGKSYIKK